MDLGPLNIFPEPADSEVLAVEGVGETLQEERVLPPGSGMLAVRASPAAAKPCSGCGSCVPSSVVHSSRWLCSRMPPTPVGLTAGSIQQPAAAPTTSSSTKSASGEALPREVVFLAP